MRRYVRIYKTFFLTSFYRELEFRANFMAKMGQNIVWLCFFLLILKVVYLNTDAVAGWTEGDGYILAATCFLMLAIVNGFFTFNLIEIPEKVRKGTLDFDLVKPIDAQFLLSLRKINFDEISTLPVGLVVVFVGAYMGGHTPTAVDIGVYLLLLCCSIAIFYGFNLLMMTLGIWLVRVENLWVLGDSVSGIARFPMDIFGPPIRRFLTYVLPLAFIATVPSMALMGKLSTWIALLGMVWGIGFFAVSRWFFRFALRHYTSASS